MNTQPLKQAIKFIRQEARCLQESSTVFKNGEGIQWDDPEDKYQWASMIDLADQCEALLERLDGPRKYDVRVVGTILADKDWRTWEGGPCPVDPGQCVEVELRTGERAGGAARAFDWDRHQDKHPMEDIVAWRLVINRSHLT